LEHYYRDGTPILDTYAKELEEGMPNLWPMEKESFEKNEQLMYDMLLHYQMWQDQDTKMYSDKNLEFISLEKEFEVALPTPGGRISKKFGLGGRFDGVVRHIPTGEYWIWETKTTRSVQELVGSLANDEQCGVYMYAASRMLKVPIVGVLYNMLRKKGPTSPKMLQSGLLSKEAKVDCTAFWYLATIRRTHPDWNDDTIQEFYGDILQSLRDKETTYFMRYPVYRTPLEIKNLMVNIYWTACEMIKPNVKLYPSPGWLACTFCTFKSPCVTMNAGGNFQALIDSEYQLRVPFEPTLTEDDITMESHAHNPEG